MPSIYIHDFRLLSSLGESPRDTIRSLASESPASDRRYPEVPDPSLYRESQTRLEKTLPSHDITRGLIVAGALFFPLVDRLKTLPHDKTDLTGFVFGNSTSGLADVIRDLRGDKNDAPSLWHNLELGRPASLLARAVLDDYPHIGPAYVVSTACTAGAKAIIEAARLLLSGTVTRVIAGGADILNDFTAEGFTSLGAVARSSSRPFCADRDGLRLGEGGALFLLSLEPELGGIPARWKLTGWGETADAHHISAPLPDGSEARRAIQTALGTAHKKKVDFICLHGTGTEQNDRAESAALAGLLADVPAASFKRLTGHQLAGAGAFGAALACSLIDKGETPLPLNFTRDSSARDEKLEQLSLTGPDPLKKRVSSALINAFAFGGSNVALIVESARTPEDFRKLSPEARARLFTAEALLPQRPPMLLIERPLAIYDDGAESESIVSETSLLTENGLFSPEGLIEIMAQTVGLYAGASTLIAGDAVEPGLLLGTRKLQLPAEPIPVGTRLLTRGKKIFSDESGLWQFACEVDRCDNETRHTVATATLTLFSPPEGYWTALDKEEKHD